MNTAGEAMGLLEAGKALREEIRDERGLRRLVERGVPSESIELLIENLPAAQRKAWRGLLSAEGKSRLPLESGERAARLA